jgi:two-component system OmpR family response regulator
MLRPLPDPGGMSIPLPTALGHNSAAAPEARILVVDDEPSIVDLLREALRYAGFEVTSADNGFDAVRLAREQRPDLLVLDVMMPGYDGLDVVRRLRSEGDRVPVLFLTARDAPQDAVAGLTIGADDYLTKPFSLGELVARIRAVLRRAGAARHDDVDVLTFADLTLDEDAHQVTKAGELIELSPTEFKLLRYFMENPGIVLSKSRIIDHVWQYDFVGDTNVVESYVSHLRRKVDQGEPRLLHTVRGVGYVLRRPRAS